MSSKSIKKNFVFNLIYQILILVAPLIVTPYVSRVLEDRGIGEYSYANSIVSYFVLVAVLGTSTYGQRAIGYTQDNIEARSRAFWEILLFRLLTSIVTFGAYVVYLLIVSPESSFLLYEILALNIFNVVIDISWFMQGMEEFGKTATTSIIFRILNIVFVFFFVKQSTDLWKYALISIGFTVLGNLYMWIYLPRNLCKVKGIKPFRNWKGIIQLFLPTIATQIYLILDKSMIGWFSDGYNENGYYEQADKIVKMALTAVTALGVVMIPRIANTYKNGNIELIRSYIYKSYRYVWMLAVPIMFGLIAISSVFVPIFFGTGYEKCNIIIPMLSVLTIFIGLSNVTGMQYFVPTGKQNVLTITVSIGAVVNVILNLIFIPFFASIGAGVASIIAEFCVTVAGLIYVRRKHLFALKPIITCSWKYWISGIVMFGAVLGVKYILPITVWALVVLVILGIVIYFLMLLILRDSMLLEFIMKFFTTVKTKFTCKKVQSTMVTEDVIGEKCNEQGINAEDDLSISDVMKMGEGNGDRENGKK